MTPFCQIRPLLSLFGLLERRGLYALAAGMMMAGLLEVGEDGSVDYFDPRGAGIIARQRVQSVYHRYGVAYAIRRECLLEQKSIMGENSGAVVINEPLANVDTLEDFERAESLLG